MSRFLTLSILGALTLTGCEIEEVTYDTGADDTGSDDGGDDTGGDDTGEEDVDADGDGYGASVDCDDTDPAINPGAKESCGSGDLNCDGVEPGDVTWTAADGSQTDLTSTFSGTSEAPVSWTSSEDGELELCTGTYYAHLHIEHDVEITTNTPWSTTLDGGESGRVITAQTEGTALSIDGVNVKNGAADYGAGISCHSVDLELSNLSVSYNVASGGGGGISAVNCDTTLNTVEVAHNDSGDTGGGIKFETSSIASATPTLDIDTCDIRENTADSAGGIDITGYSGKPLEVKLANIGFYDNDATTTAGGLRVSGESTVTVTDNADFYGNSAGTYGGGMHINAYQSSAVNPVVTMTNTDWGDQDSSDDNSPEDLTLAGVGDASWQTFDLDSSVSSISCSEDGCDVTD